jgi:hypothetical protein
MKATLLAADFDELARVGTTVTDAFGRGSAALGSRPIRDRATGMPGTEAAVQELIHLYGETYAQMRLLQFAFTTKTRNFERSKGRYEAVEDALFEASRRVVPPLRMRLGEIKQREQALVRELEARGIQAGTIGPIVPLERAQETSLRPGEGPPERRTLPPLARRPSLLERLRGTRRR